MYLQRSSNKNIFVSQVSTSKDEALIWPSPGDTERGFGVLKVRFLKGACDPLLNYRMGFWIIKGGFTYLENCVMNM